MKGPRCGGWFRLLIAAFVLLGPALASGDTILVSAGDKSTIGEALARSKAGDTVLVGCGTYFEQMLSIPDGVTLAGYGDASCVVIQTTGPMPVFHCESVGAATRVENLTVTIDSGGAAPIARGAGAYLSNAAPVFSQVTFTGLEADYGGAVYCGEGSAPVFEDCRFEANYARAVGGAVASSGGSVPQFVRCLFEGNTAETTGGAVNAGFGASASLVECTLVGNDAVAGSGLATWDAAGLVVERCIIADGINGRGWDGDNPSVPVPACTDIFNNAGGDWVGALAPYAAVGGNLGVDPEFCTYQSDNPYTLHDTSPCAVAACGAMGAFPVDCDWVSDAGAGNGVPRVSRLYSNYPNPFNPRTTIKYELNKSGSVELSVFDVAGRLVERLVDGAVAAGVHEAVWEGRDSRGRQAAAGVYFFRLKTADTIDTKRMTLVK